MRSAMNPIRNRRLALWAALAFLLAALVNAQGFRLGAAASQGDRADFQTLAELCLGFSPDGAPIQLSRGHCDFCNLIASPGLASAPEATHCVPTDFLSVAYVATSQIAVRPAAFPGARVRAPPVLSA
ncbi:hypothetical protein ACKTEK_02390 [Tepidamorphus sp. 3E244]|uniref:hypothetical protein n=1 Tax=Tepidamorphus sp. 3E244 TaxID=3385498 RepID=UPI0038FC23BB